MQEGEHPLMLLSSIYRTVRKLLIAKALIEEKGMSTMEMQAELRMHPYYAQRFVEALKKCRIDSLKKCLELAATADTALKTSGSQDPLILEELIIAVCRP